MRNTEKCYSREEIKGNPNEYAKKFSEGNKSLENLLLFCFNNNIMTRGCCAGHDNVFNPNICFDLDENQTFLASSIFENILNSKLGQYCDFRIMAKNNNNYYVGCHVNDIKYNDIFFDTILNIIKANINIKNNSSYNEIFNILNLLKDINNFDSDFFIDPDGKINYFVYRLTYIKELNGEMPKALKVIDGSYLIDYFKNLKAIDNYNDEDLNNSYIFNSSNIHNLTQVIQEAKERTENIKFNR